LIWILSAFLLAQFYLAELKSHELVPKVQNTEKTFNELIKDGWKFRTVDYWKYQSWYRNYLKSFLTPSKELETSQGETMKGPLAQIVEN